MAREKDIVLKEESVGNIYVDEAVVKKIVAVTSKEVAGVGDFSAGFLNVFNNKTKHVAISNEDENKLSVEVFISVYYGYNLIEVAENVQSSVQKTLEENLKLSNFTVTVTIRELITEKEEEEEETKEAVELKKEEAQ